MFQVGDVIIVSRTLWKPLVFWLDNEEGPLSDFKQYIDDAFAQASRDLSIDKVSPETILFRSGKELIKTIESSAGSGIADIVGCDFSLDEDDLGNGEVAVDKIRSLMYPTGIIIYGNSGKNATLEREVHGWYGSITVCKDERGVKDALISLARKSIVRWTDKEYVRGLVISRVSDIEVALDDLLVDFYKVKKDLRYRFEIDVLQADLLGLGKKVTILESLLKQVDDTDATFSKAWKKQFGNDMGELIQNRNRAAHGVAGLESDGSFYLVNRGKKKVFSRGELGKHFLRAYECHFKILEMKNNLDKFTAAVIKSKVDP